MHEIERAIASGSEGTETPQSSLSQASVCRRMIGATAVAAAAIRKITTINHILIRLR